MDALSQFIQSNPDPRELKRALAVQMSQRKHSSSRDSSDFTGVVWIHQQVEADV